MLTKTRIGHIMTELDILESSLISFSMGKKSVDEAIECVRVFRKEVEKLMN